ncbi:Uncharacterized conserved protein, DUF2336 family [Rhizobium sp. RU20A]|nr:Uncharacterized conserved protein, DUF2336 family [Rhizobium sp. RU20A]
MTFLLDDPSPKVRLALAEAIADSADAPRSLILPLAADQPEVAYTVIFRSPVLTDDDLVDLAARGTAELRGVIAARRQISPGISAAIVEIGGLAEMLILLDNDNAVLTPRTLRRIAERFGHVPEARERLLAHSALPSDVRHILIEKVGQALALSGLVRAVVGGERVDRIAREACDTAAVEMAGTSPQAELPRLVAHLRDTGRLTPAFLLHALVSGRIDFFATAIVILSTVDERRVRSILSDGRLHAIRALFQSAGLTQELGALFAEGVLLWRSERTRLAGGDVADVAQDLLQRLAQTKAVLAGSPAVRAILEQLSIAERRRGARAYASQITRKAA